MHRFSRRSVLIPPMLTLLSAIVACSLQAKDEQVDGVDGLVDPSELREQCATRLAIAFTGVSASATLIASADPQAAVPTFVTDPKFVERFSRFMNKRLNPIPGETAGEDASYFLTAYVLRNGKPFKDLFAGPYDVDAAGAVTSNANGLGYFRSRPWMVRYAGNELAGYRIVSGYRILQNTTGLQLSAITNVVDVDLSATGRLAPGCRGCHFDGWFALDKVARVLSRRQGSGDSMTFVAPSDGPQQILGGLTIASDKELVTALLASDHFKVNACRHVFNFLYGRDESTSEGTVFDKCVDALTSQGTIQAALVAVAQDPSFCP